MYVSFVTTYVLDCTIYSLARRGKNVSDRIPRLRQVAEHKVVLPYA